MHAPDLEAESIVLGEHRGWMSTARRGAGFKVEIHLDGRRGVTSFAFSADRSAAQQQALRSARQWLAANDNPES
mgnify:CR=1 FL=1